MMLLIGSRALKYWRPEVNIKKDADWDVIESSFTDGNKASRKDGPYEFHNALSLNNQDSYRYTTNHSIVGPNGLTLSICSLRGLAAIKRSHLHRPLKFGQHIQHYQLLDRNFNDQDIDFIAERTRLTKEIFIDKTPSLDMSIDKFFDDFVSKVLVHDDIHDIIAHYDEPLYKKMQRNPSQARCERDLWDQFSLKEKTQCVQEEAYVIAIERYTIPWFLKGKNYPHKMAFYRALERICTTLCGGFFRDHAIDHWYQAVQFKQSIFDNFFNSKLWHDYSRHSRLAG